MNSALTQQQLQEALMQNAYLNFCLLFSNEDYNYPFYLKNLRFQTRSVYNQLCLQELPNGKHSNPENLL